MANPTNPESWFPRCRLAWLERRAKHLGHVGRGDLMRTFGISPAQASGDLQAYIAANPGAITYATSRKRYEWVDGAEFVIVPPPWESLTTH